MLMLGDELRAGDLMMGRPLPSGFMYQCAKLKSSTT